MQTDALQEVEDQLCVQGIPFLRQTVVEDGVEVQQIFCHDADNNMIEVSTRLACTLDHPMGTHQRADNS